MAEDRELTWRGHVSVWALGVLVALLAWFSGNSAEVPPTLWDEIAVALGMRPPPTVFPGLWRCAVAGLFGVVGLENGLTVLRVLGPVSLALVAVLTFRLFDEVIPNTLRLHMRNRGWTRRIVCFMLLQGVVFFVCSEPVWQAGRVFSPTMLLLLLTLVAARLFFHTLRTSSRRYAVAMSAVLGMLFAETPLGLLPMPIFPLVVILRANKNANEVVFPFANPLVRLITFRRMTLMFLGGFMLTFVANTLFFAGHDGLVAQDWNAFTYVLRHLYHHVEILKGAVTAVGLLFVIGIVLAPAAISLVLIGKATDDDRFLPYHHGLYFSGIGILAFLQSAGWKSFWFWTWVEAPAPVSSDYLLCLCLLVTSMTAMLSLCVLGVEIYFRNYRRIALFRYEDAVEADPAAAKMVKRFKLVDRVVRATLLYEPLVVAAMIIPFKFATTEGKMAAIVNEGARQTAAECGDAHLLFTDGALDAAVEVAARAQNRSVKALSMMGGTTPYEIYLRTRHEDDEENRTMLTLSAADALRTWVRSKPECATNIALQLGFELWRHDKLPMPPCGGLVARTAGFAPGEADRWRTAATNLAERILALYKTDKPMGIANLKMRSMFMFLQWRLARMCRLRSDAADTTRNIELAMEESDLADKLDEKNVAYSRIRRQMDWVGQQKGMRLTPREGLKIGLNRADFRLARTFAQQVLVSDPNNTRANFAMGMGYFIDEQYSRAEVYLKRCLVNKPNEPVVLNNLAIIQSRLGKLEEAETNVTKAIKIFPTSQEIKKTHEHILQLNKKKRQSTPDGKSGEAK